MRRTQRRGVGLTCRPDRVTFAAVRALLAFLVMAWASTAQGQAAGSESGEEDGAGSVPGGGPRTQVIQAVERGFFLQTDLGGNIVVADDSGSNLDSGAVIGLFAGGDVLPVLSLSLGLMAATASGRFGSGNGDRFYLSPVGRVQVALLTSQRNFFWVRADGGVAFALPDEVDGRDNGGAGPVFGGALVYEHFTRLRHFSLGLSAGVMAYLEPETVVSIQITPLLKYTF